MSAKTLDCGCRPTVDSTYPNAPWLHRSCNRAGTPLSDQEHAAWRAILRAENASHPSTYDPPLAPVLTLHQRAAMGDAYSDAHIDDDD